MSLGHLFNTIFVVSFNPWCFYFISWIPPPPPHCSPTLLIIFEQRTILNLNSGSHHFESFYKCLTDFSVYIGVFFVYIGVFSAYIGVFSFILVYFLLILVYFLYILVYFLFILVYFLFILVYFLLILVYFLFILVYFQMFFISTFLSSNIRWVVSKILARSVQPFLRLIDTNKQTPGQAKNIFIEDRSDT